MCPQRRVPSLVIWFVNMWARWGTDKQFESEQSCIVAQLVMQWSKKRKKEKDNEHYVNVAVLTIATSEWMSEKSYVRHEHFDRMLLRNKCLEQRQLMSCTCRKRSAKIVWSLCACFVRLIKIAVIIALDFKPIYRLPFKSSYCEWQLISMMIVRRLTRRV